LINNQIIINPRCPSGLHWNQDKCDWPQNSNCVSTTDTEEPDSDNDIDAPAQKPSTKKPMTQQPTTSRATARPSSPTRKPASTQKPATTQKPVTQKPTNRPTRPPVGDSSVTLTGNEQYKIVCYFTNWAWYRPGVGKYKPSDIDANLCTHIVYGFAVLNRDTLTIRTHDSWADIDNDFYGKVAEFKNKGIKVTLAIGGWNDSLGDKYSRLVRDAAARARFIKHVVEFIKKYGFQGLDLDW
jgi:chitinase